MWFRIALACSLLAVSSVAFALSSGRYGPNLSLAVDPDGGLLTANLAWPGPDGKARCRLYVFGEPSSDDQYLLTATDGAGILAQGQLRADTDQQSLQLSLDSLTGVCAPVAAVLKHGVDLRLSEAKPWHGIRWVASERAYFHNEAHESTRRKAYVVRGDAIAYTGETAAFVDAEYLQAGSKTRGWLSWEDLEALQANEWAVAAPALPKLSQPARLSERAAWRQLLGWADHNEEHYASSIGADSAEGGLSIVGRAGHTALLRVSFGYAAYQEIMGFALLDESEGSGRLLTLPGFPVDAELTYSEVFGFDDFDPATNTLNVFSKSRGMGDCGRVFQYHLDETGLTLQQWRMRECSDEPEEGDIDTDAWPVQSGDPDQE